MFINWENIDLKSETKEQTSSSGRGKKSVIHEENERKRLAQLQKLQSYKDSNEHRRNIIARMTKFGEFLTNDKKEEIATLLTEECEIFLFNFAEIIRVKLGFEQDSFLKLLQDYQITEREIKYTSVDSKQATGFQFCHYIIKNEKDSSSISQFSFEIFSFKNAKIHKYRAIFGCMPQLSDAQSLFTISRKEKMLTQVKEMNYALADQPNLEKFASLLNENTEYKIWRWKDKKCCTFTKHNFASEFRKSLEEDFMIKSIVPFDPSIEAQYLVGSYVFYLEGKGEFSGKQCQWISTCIFAFDKDANLMKISQQGELYEEDEILIPFEVYTEEKTKELINTIYEYMVGKNTDISIFSHEDVNFSFDLGIFSDSTSLSAGLIRGLSEYKRLAEVLVGKDGDFGLATPIDTYLDCEDLCYDTAITIDYSKGVVHKECPFNGKIISVYGMRKYSFENGKLAKVIIFAMGFSEPIPSPYIDSSFTDLNIGPKH